MKMVENEEKLTFWEIDAVTRIVVNRTLYIVLKFQNNTTYGFYAT